MKRPNVNAAINYAACPVRKEVIFFKSLQNVMHLPTQNKLSTITALKNTLPVISLKSVHKTLWTAGQESVIIPDQQSIHQIINNFMVHKISYARESFLSFHAFEVISYKV